MATAKRVPVNAPTADMAMDAMRAEFKKRRANWQVDTAYKAASNLPDSGVAITVTNDISRNVTFMVICYKAETVRNDS